MITRSLLLSYLEDCASIFGAHIPTISKGIGIILLVAPFGAYFVFPALDLAHVLMHTAVVGPFSAAVIYGGYWLERSGVSSHRWPRIAKWLFGVLLGFLALNVFMMTLWGNGIYYNFMWALFAANVGSTAGLGLGIFEARTIGQAQLAERRRLRQEAAHRRSQQFENFAKIVSHDLRNPLNVAWGHLDLATDDGDSVHLSAIRDALGRMDEIIEDVQMLTWSGQNIRGEDRELQRLGDVARTSWSYVEVSNARLQIEDNLTVCANHARLQRLLEISSGTQWSTGGRRSSSAWVRSQRGSSSRTMGRAFRVRNARWCSTPGIPRGKGDGPRIEHREDDRESPRMVRLGHDRTTGWSPIRVSQRHADTV